MSSVLLNPEKAVPIKNIESKMKVVRKTNYYKWNITKVKPQKEVEKQH